MRRHGVNRRRMYALATGGNPVQRESQEFLERLMATISPSGYEDEAARVWRAEAEKFAAEVYVDAHGNAIAVVNPGGSPRVMLAGHMDEIGFTVTHIDEHGFLHFAPIGGWDPQIAQGQRVTIRTKNGPVRGVLGKKAVHLLTEEERHKVVKLEDMWIDIGAASADEAKSLVQIGDPVVLAWGFELLRNNLAVSRGLDDKAGAFVVLEAARILARLRPQAAVYAVATVQEEVGLRGATTATYDIAPQVAIAVDVGHATDSPGMGNAKNMGEAKLGEGAIISRGPNINPKLFDLMVSAADAEGIKYQIKAAPRGTGTDANAMQLIRGAKAAGLVSIPNRYMHSPVEIVSLDDLESCYRILAATVMRIGPDTSFVPW